MFFRKKGFFKEFILARDKILKAKDAAEVKHIQHKLMELHHMCGARLFGFSEKEVAKRLTKPKLVRDQNGKFKSKIT